MFFTDSVEYYNLAFTSGEPWLILSPVELEIKRKIEAAGVPLKDWGLQINIGIMTAFDKVFIINGEKRAELIKKDSNCEALLKPILEGEDIKRYEYKFADRWLINTHNGVRSAGLPPVNIDEYPVLKEYFDPYYEKLAKRSGRGLTPYNLRSCAYWQDFAKPKLIYPETTQCANFAYDERGLFIKKTAFFITGSNLKYLLGVLNSRLMDYAFKNFFATCKLGAQGLQYNKQALEKLPVPRENNGEIEELVERRLRGEAVDLDAAVYKLYRLAAEEIEEIQNAYA